MLGLGAYRLSVEWARIEPEPGRIDQSVLDHYRRVLDALRAADIEPVVTLHHFTNPLWLAARGGWSNSEVVPRFAAYAERVARALGDLVQWWVTVNEPSVFGTLGYLDGIWPPHHRRDVRGYLRHMRHCAQGHVAARQALRALWPHAQASLAFPLYPLDLIQPSHPADRMAARLYDWLREGSTIARTRHALDWVGVNYYFRLQVRWDPRPWALFARTSMGPGEKTDAGWEMYPEGMYRVLRRAGEIGKPVLVTENGLADAADRWRGRFIVEHLRQVHRAIAAGVDVRGYLHWSLLDNFEWAEGYTKRYGLVEVDVATQARTPRPSAQAYAAIAHANAIQPPADGT
jgi:beta-glucosidase